MKKSVNFEWAFQTHMHEKDFIMSVFNKEKLYTNNRDSIYVIFLSNHISYLWNKGIKCWLPRHSPLCAPGAPVLLHQQSTARSTMPAWSFSFAGQVHTATASPPTRSVVVLALLVININYYTSSYHDKYLDMGKREPVESIRWWGCV